MLGFEQPVLCGNLQNGFPTEDMSQFQLGTHLLNAVNNPNGDSSVPSAAIGSGLSGANQMRCDRHDTERLVAYCRNCKVAVCANCMDQHNALYHKLIPTGQFCDEARNQLKKLTDTAKYQIDACTARELSMRKSIDQIYANRDELKQKATDSLKSCQAALDKLFDETAREIEDNTKRGVGRFQSSISDLKNVIDKLTETYTSADSVVRCGGFVDLLASDPLKEMLKSCITVGIDYSGALMLPPAPLKFTRDAADPIEALRPLFGKLVPEKSNSGNMVNTNNATGINANAPSWVNAESAKQNMNGQQNGGRKSPDSKLNVPRYVPPQRPASLATYDGLGGFANGILDNHAIYGNRPEVLSSLGTSAQQPQSTFDQMHEQPMLFDPTNLAQRLSQLGQDSRRFGALESGVESAPRQSTSGFRVDSRNFSESEYDSRPASSFVQNNAARPGSSTSGAIGYFDAAVSNNAAPRRGSTAAIRERDRNALELKVVNTSGELGSAIGQLNYPHGFCRGLKGEIVVADTLNNRICIYDPHGTFMWTFGQSGKDISCFNGPRKVIVLPNGKFVVCDRGQERSRMQVFSPQGEYIQTIVVKYIDIVAGLAVNSEGHIVAVDSVNPTIFIISELGQLMYYLDCSKEMKEPSDIQIYNGDYYICDFKGHCIVVYNQAGEFLRKIGQETLTDFPNGIDITSNGDVVVGDSHGNRFHVVVFNNAGTLLRQYLCLKPNVSRSCGLRLTPEGYIVTVAKNNHMLLILQATD